MNLLEQLLTHRARRLRASKPYRIAKRPPQPRAAELAYVADLRRLVSSWGEVADKHIVPHLEMIANARVDHAPQSFNEFIVFSDTLTRLTGGDAIIPLFQKQADRIAQFSTRALAESMGIEYGAFKGAAQGILAPGFHDFVEVNTGLIRTLTRSYINRVGDTLTEMQGARASDISQALQYDLDVTKSHADLIAVDQTLKLNSDFTRVRQEQVGVTSYVWMTAHDERVRPAHAALDGTHQDWSNPPVVDERTGRREPPGRDFRCRCQAIAIIPGFN